MPELKKYLVTWDRITPCATEVFAESPEQAAEIARGRSLAQFRDGPWEWNGEPDVEEIAPPAPRWISRTLAVVQIVLNEEDEEIASDLLGDLLDDERVLDWGYLKVGVSCLLPKEIVIQVPYVEGSAFGEPVPPAPGEEE